MSPSPLVALTLACLLFGCGRADAFPFRASPPGGPLPPNSVRLEVDVDSCVPDGAEDFLCALRVARVVEYGRGGPVTLVESTVQASFDRSRLHLGGPPPDGARLDLLLIRTSVPGETDLRAARLYTVTLP